MKPLSLIRSSLLGSVPPPAAPSAEHISDLSSEYSQFTVPGPVADAIVWAARSTDLGRHNTAGGRYLRHAIIEKLRDANDLESSDAGIVLTGGSGIGLGFSLGAICDPGDQILVPDPGSDSYGLAAATWGVRSVRYPIGLDGLPVWHELEDLVEHETKAIVVANPVNPSGAVLNGTVLQELVDFARGHDLYLLADEQFDMVRFDGKPAIGAARFDTDGRVISVFGMSRTHALAGLRLGYVVAAPPIAELLHCLQACQLSGPSALAMSAGLAALTMDRSVVDSMLAAYLQARDVAEVNLPAEVLPFQPQGGYFMLVDVSSTVFPDGAAFATELLSQRHVRVAPGTRFGRTTQRMVRLTLAVKERTLGQGVGGLAAFLEENRA